MPTSTFVESGFWCFDALFVPQQHPARDLQDTFYLSGRRIFLFYDSYVDHVNQILRNHFLQMLPTTIVFRRPMSMEDMAQLAIELLGLMRSHLNSCYAHILRHHQHRCFINWLQNAGASHKRITAQLMANKTMAFVPQSYSASIECSEMKPWMPHI